MSITLRLFGLVLLVVFDWLVLVVACDFGDLIAGFAS